MKCLHLFLVLLLLHHTQCDSLEDLSKILRSDAWRGWNIHHTPPPVGNKVPPGVDPEAGLTFCQISNYHNYECEEYFHKVVTKDGFLLTLHRVTGRMGRNQTGSARKPPVFVQHGLLCDSTSWVLNLPNQNLPFLLSDAGYDVWVGNSRGNTYSRAHKTLNPDQSAFWAWSWDEMALYDLPASLEYVSAYTGYSKMPYIGHSQGTLIAFIHMSVTGDTTRISHLIAMGPVFHLGHMEGALKYLSYVSYDIAAILEVFGMRDFLPSNWMMKLIADVLCVRYDPFHVVCRDVIFSMAGFDVKQLNQTRVPVYLSHTPAGTSVRNILHFAQLHQAKNCSRYNYGSASENIKHYGTSVPPAYNISRIRHTPVSLYWAENDWLADPQDVQYLIKNLPTVRDSVYVPTWNHLDFIWALDAKRVVYDSIIQLLKKNL